MTYHEMELVSHLAFRLIQAFKDCDAESQHNILDLITAINNCPRRDLIASALELTQKYLRDEL